MTGLFNLAAAFEGVRRQCKEWKWRAIKAEGELEELRMRLHQVGMSDPKAKADALNWLKAEVNEYHKRFEEYPF